MVKRKAYWAVLNNEYKFLGTRKNDAEKWIKKTNATRLPSKRYKLIAKNKF